MGALLALSGTSNVHMVPVRLRAAARGLVYWAVALLGSLGHTHIEIGQAATDVLWIPFIAHVSAPGFGLGLQELEQVLQAAETLMLSCSRRLQ